MYECVQCVYTHAINICMYVHIYVYVYTHCTYSYTFIYIYIYIHRCMLYKRCVYCWNQSWPAIHASHRFKIKSGKKKERWRSLFLLMISEQNCFAPMKRVSLHKHTLCFTATSSQPFCNAKLIQHTLWRMCCLQCCLVLVKTTGGER